MNAVLAHRGPDDDTAHVEPSIGLGHRRLRIIDLEGGRQPMFSGDGSRVIVFNGEIYNFPTLRKDLEEKGHTFSTRSDTEVILHAYEEYGVDSVRHLRGMFAFAIWDRSERVLFLARDRVGIKPLYYYWDGTTFLFGSEIKAILEHPVVKREVDACAIDDFLTFLYIPAPRTIFRNVYKLPPGHFLVVSDNGIREQEYWDLSFEPRNGGSEVEAISGLMEKLREAVSIHMISDVPLGAFLSGGVDSSCVVGLMSELSREPVKTASIGFQEAGYDELPYARAIAERFETETYEKIVRPEAVQILDSLVWHYDEPFADASMVPTYYVSKVAREQVTVCLSGDGGDENFAGYRRYRFDVMENRIRSVIPEAVRKILFGSLGRLYPKADWLPRIFRAKTTLTNLSRCPGRGYFHSMSCFHEELKRRLYRPTLQRKLSGYDPFSVFERHLERTDGWDPLSRIQYLDIKTYLVDDILTKVDRASMAHSLEVRVPILDHEVMEFAAGIPSHMKLRNGQGKYIFKKALQRLVPEDVLYRQKMGFSMPLAQWLRNELKDPFESAVLSGGGFLEEFLDVDVIRRWWRQHQRGVRDYSTHLWALLVMERWGRKFLP